MGGAGAAAFPAPSAPTLAPAALSSTTDLIRQLQQPAAARYPPEEPPTSGRARGDSSWLAPPPCRWGRPSLPPPPLAQIIIPVTCLSMHPKAGPRFCNTLRGRGGGHWGGREGRRAWAPAPLKSFSYLGGSPSAPASGAPAPARGQDTASCRCLLN